MGTFGDKFGEAWRNYNTDGVPASGDYEPEKALIRGIGPALDASFATLVMGMQSYATVADLPTSPAPSPGTQARVFDDPTDTNNVVWKYVDGAWSIDSDFYSALATIVQPLVDEAEGWAEAAAASAAGIASMVPKSAMAALSAAQRSYTGTGTRIPLISDADYGTLLGVDIATGDPYGLMIDRISNNIDGDFGPTLSSLGVTNLPALAGWNGQIVYGQSNGGGTDSAVLTTTTAYTGMKTFGSGPKSSKAGNAQGAVNTSPGTSTTIALVEDSGQSDGFTPSGETICSGTARRFLDLAATKNGADPNATVLLCSTAAHGSYRITSLYKAAPWYQQLLDHVSEGKARATAAGQGYAVQAIDFVQGEQDTQGSETYSNYLGYLTQLQVDIDTDIRAITGQTQRVHMLISPNPYLVTTNDAVVRAQMDACVSSAYIHLAGPRYHLDHRPGLVHMTAESKFRHGADFGRARHQLVYGQRKPDQIRFVSATAQTIGGVTTLTVTCKVPQPPLVLDTSFLPAGVQDYGIKVVDGTGTLTLSNIAVQGRELMMTLNRALGSNPLFRYALDYQPTVPLVSGNAAGNLRDSTADTILVNGVAFLHPYVAPPVQLSILKLAS